VTIDGADNIGKYCINWDNIRNSVLTSALFLYVVFIRVMA
jgi:hypothetical protein